MIICFRQVQHTIENIRVFYRSSSSSSFPSEVIISSMTDLSTQNLLFAFKKRSIASESGSMWLLRCDIMSFALLKRCSQIFEVLETCKVERYKDLSVRCLIAESLSSRAMLYQQILHSAQDVRLLYLHRRHLQW